MVNRYAGHQAERGRAISGPMSQPMTTPEPEPKSGSTVRSEPAARAQSGASSAAERPSDAADIAARAELEALIRNSGRGCAEISRLIGRNAAYVQQYLKRGIPRRLAEADRRRLAAYFGVPETLLGGLPTPARSLSPEPARHATHEISFLDGRPAKLTIDGAFVASLHPGAERPAGLSLAAHRVEGDSMAPTLLAGDHLLVDLADCGPPRDGVYVIEGETAPLVKRLSANPVSHRVAILSDNAAYPSFPDCDPAEIRLVGRVIWVGRALP